LADELRRNFRVEAEVVKSGGGVFDVVVDGKLVFSKDRTGRFPNVGEISKLLK